MGCNCGKNKQVITSAQAEEIRQQALFEQRVQEESDKASTGEHMTRVIPKVVRR